MSIHISITDSQAIDLVDEWNALANSRNQLTYTEAHLIMAGDNFDDELFYDGVTTVEVGRFKSVSGNPDTFNVWASDVCIAEGMHSAGDAKSRYTKAAIQALATQSVKDQYAVEADQLIYLEGVIEAGGFCLSLTDRPTQWERCTEWLEEAVA
tara:strand:+ start:646 stop:1104 length:459 start_codon:yes stop_codon:yes gene_type:complete